MNQFNDLHGDEIPELKREWNIQPPESQFKSCNCPLKTSTVVSATMWRLDHHDIDDGDVEVHPSYFPIKYNYESVPNPNTTPIKSIDDDEMDRLLEIFH